MGILGENVPTIKAIDCCLRLLVIPLSITSIWLTISNKEDNIIYGTLDFTNLKGLKYIAWVSAISGGYALVAAISSWVNFLMNKPWFFFVSDQVVAYIMVTSGAALSEIIYLAYNGAKSVTWSEACTSYGKFCSRLNIILVLNAIALFCFLFLAVISAYRAFSTYDPPFVTSKEVQEEEMT